MGKITISPTTTVLKLKEEFKNEFGGTLRVYNGRSEAKDDETLVSLGAKTGTVEFRANRTVGSFCDEVMKELNLKVKVATVDNWVMVLDGVTLATVKDIPKQCTKQQMEEFVGYKREIERANSLSNPFDSLKKNNIVTLDLPSAEGLKYQRDWDKDGEGGYINKKREWVIPSIYTYGDDFSENVAVVHINGEVYGYINALGEWLIKPQFEIARRFENGKAFVKQNDKWGVINLIGEWIVDPILDSEPHFYSDNRDVVSIDGKYGVIDESFSWIIPPLYDDINERNGFYITEYKNKIGLLNTEGGWAIEPLYDSLRFSRLDKCIVAEFKNQYGYLDFKGNWVLNPNFEALDSFKEDLGGAKKDGKWGYINLNGEWIIKPIFDSVSDFQNGTAGVVYKGMDFQIDTKGQIKGKNIEEYIKENPCFEGWEKSVELAKKTKSVSIPLHKYGDGYALEEDIKEMANDYIFFLTDNKGNFKGFLYNGWDNIQEFMDGNPEYSSIYYYSNGDYQISESIDAIYQSDEEWPTVDRTMDEAIVETVNMETEYYYPNIDFNLIYNGDVIYENNLAS